MLLGLELNEINYNIVVVQFLTYQICIWTVACSWCCNLWCSHHHAGSDQPFHSH